MNYITKNLLASADEMERVARTNSVDIGYERTQTRSGVPVCVLDAPRLARWAARVRDSVEAIRQAQEDFTARVAAAVLDAKKKGLLDDV